MALLHKEQLDDNTIRYSLELTKDEAQILAEDILCSNYYSTNQIATLKQIYHELLKIER